MLLFDLNEHNLAFENTSNTGIVVNALDCNNPDVPLGNVFNHNEEYTLGTSIAYTDVNTNGPQKSLRGLVLGSDLFYMSNVDLGLFFFICRRTSFQPSEVP